MVTNSKDYGQEWRKNHPEYDRARYDPEKTAAGYRIRHDRDPEKFRDWGRGSYARRNGHALPPLEKDCRSRPTDGCCECCATFVGREKLCLDHDHMTGVFRGWICHRCNVGFGFFGDTLDGIRNALKYLTNQRRGEQNASV